MHNLQNITGKYSPSEDELNEAMDRIREAVSNNKPWRPTIVIRSTAEVDRVDQDILDRSQQEIFKGVAKKRTQLGPPRREEPLRVTTFDEAYQRGQLNHIFFGKMGDYVGDNSAQSFTDILIEKAAYIADHGKCLWTTAGPTIDNVNEFIKKYGLKDSETGEKRIWAVFALTSSKYPVGKQVTYYWEDSDHQRMEDTAPPSKTGKRKALVINRFWIVEDYVNLPKFAEIYYPHRRACLDRANNYKPLMNKPIDTSTRFTPCCMTKKKIVQDNVNIQRDLGIESIMDEFQRSAENADCNLFSDSCGAVYYILAEVTGFVSIHSDTSLPKE